MLRNALLSFVVSFLSLFAQAQQAWVPGEVLVLLKKEARLTDVQRELSNALPAGLSIKGVEPIGKKSRYVKLALVGSSMNDIQLEKFVARVPGVQATSLNYLLEHRIAPNDALYGQQWGLQDANVDDVWDFTTGGTMANGKRIGVALSDQAIETNHEDLQDNIWPNSPAQGNGADHGTEVASVVGAVGNNGIGITGVNWDVEIYSSGTATDLSEVIEQFELATAVREQFNASNGAFGLMVVSITASWGSPDNGPCNGLMLPLFTDMTAAGIILVTGGPNEPFDMDLGTDFPANCALAEHLVVTSHGPLGQVPYATGESSVHLLAPGLNIPVAVVNDAYSLANGNSLAIPHVAGAIALLYSVPCYGFAQLVMEDPVAARAMVKNAILDNTAPFPGGDAITITGGKLNALAAYQALLAQCPACDTVSVNLTTSAGNAAVHNLENGFGVVRSEGTGSTFDFCSEDGCYTGTITDGTSQPLDGTFTVELNGTVIHSGSIVDGELSFNIGTVVPGCTSTSASNYNSAANCDDGSCCPGNAVSFAIIAADAVASGTAQLHVQANGTTLFQGPVVIAHDADAELSYGTVTICDVASCITVTSTEVDVALSQSGVAFSPQSTFPEEYFAMGTTTTLSLGHATTETCDGQDNDCDGEVDEDFLWYLDDDNDGWGAPGTGVISCTALNGRVQNEGDCDDANGDVNPDATDECANADGVDNNCNGDIDEVGLAEWYPDADNDQVGAITASIIACSAPPGYVNNTGDCDDANADVSPNALELCDGLDNDCDGTIDETFYWYTDADGDGFGEDASAQLSCTPIVGLVNTGGDCNDADATITIPGAPCDDGNAATVNDRIRPDCGCLGFVQGDCPSGEIEDCNGNCAPMEWWGDSFCDNGAFENNGVAIFFDCPAFNNDGGDCDPPCTTEVCDGTDNDCDGQVDEGFPPRYADNDNDGLGNAFQPLPCNGAGVTNADDCDDTNASIGTSGCGNCTPADRLWILQNQEAIDELMGSSVFGCIGAGLENCLVQVLLQETPLAQDCATCIAQRYSCILSSCLTACINGFGSANCQTCMETSCQPAYLSCIGITDADGDGSAAGLDCNDHDASIYPNAPEVCDGVDNNCDGSVDEGLEAIQYTDADGDGWGDDATATLGNYCTQPPNTSFNGGDCDDTDPTTYPGAPDDCASSDGVDNDCNGTVDDSGFSLWFRDADGDGYGSDVDHVFTCLAPPGYVPGSLVDCDDTDPNINQLQPEIPCDGLDNDCDAEVDENTPTWYQDLDGDGYGCCESITTCSEPAGYVLNSGDCNDQDATIHPGADDPCDGVDQNCDGFDPAVHWFRDADGDGFGSLQDQLLSCTQPPGYVDNYGDCADDDPLVNPSAVEVCDGVNNNCDFYTDEGVMDPWYADEDGDGFGSAIMPIYSCVPVPDRVTNNIDCDDGNVLRYPGATEVCNGIDDDCDGLTDEELMTTWYIDNDGDGYGQTATGLPSCTPIPNRVSVGGDCHDGDPTLFISARLTIYKDPALGEGTVHYLVVNAGDTLEGDLNFVSSFYDASVELCLAAECLSITITQNDIPLNYAFIQANAWSEVFQIEDGYLGFAGGLADLCDGIDNNCNGLVDEDAPTWYRDEDGDGFGTWSTSIVSCTQPIGYVVDNTDCDDLHAQANVNAQEICDGIDNDCDGQVDEVPDSDGDGIIDCEDGCPFLFGDVGSACHLGTDGLIPTGIINPTCTCTVACSQNIVVDLRTDLNSHEASFIIRDELTSAIRCQGGGFVPGINTPIVVDCCLPQGCFKLEVYDSGGDGFVTGGYQVREAGATGRRIIDNFGNFTSGGYSAVSDGSSFCLPMGEDKLIFGTCDKLTWVNNQYLVAHENTAVSAEWVPNGANNVQDGNSGYEFWIYDPNGSYSLRRFRSHSVSDGFNPANARRACHLKLNGWTNATLTPHAPANTLLNVRLRGRVNGVNLGEFGPACTMRIDAMAAACPSIWLQDDPSNTSDFSCGVLRNWGGANSAANRLTAKPPQFVPSTIPGPVKYQFRFRIPGENLCITRPPQSSPTIHLNWSNGPQLQCSMTYEVDVRASKDGGATWCVDGNTPACYPADPTPWGRRCSVTINPCNTGGSAMGAQSPAEDQHITIFPNPNTGDRLHFAWNDPVEASEVTVEFHAINGSLSVRQNVIIEPGSSQFALDLGHALGSGVYLARITLGEHTYIERLVIQE